MATDIIGYLESIGARRSSGSEYVLDCPFCSKTRHLYCNAEEGEGYDGKPRAAGRWICFACGEKSMWFEKLLAEVEGISFDAARGMMGHWKAGGYAWKRPTYEAPVGDPKREWLPPEFEPVSKVWPKYLSDRGITRQTAADFNLGVCRSGQYAHRIILPIDCPLGRDFQARAIHKDTNPRYLSGPDAGQLLFGWQTIEDSDMAVLVEGPFDAIAIAQAGYPCVALMGKDLRDGQWELLKRRRRKYIVMFDPLAKDRNAVDKACEVAWKLGGVVGDNLDATTDPGDCAATPEVIRPWIDAPIAPRDAMNRALLKRIARLQR